MYDFVVNGLFKISEDNMSYEYSLLGGISYKPLIKIFNNLCSKYGFNYMEIQFIEGLLFLSMIPLHKDDFDRQKIFYLKAVELLNGVIQNYERTIGI